MKKMTFIVWQCLKSTRTSEYLSGYLKWLLVMRSFLLLVDTKHRGARFQLSQNKCVRNHPPKNDTLNFSWLTYTQGKMLTFVLKCRAYISAMGGRLTIHIEAFCMHEHFSARIWPLSQITETSMCFKAYSWKAFITILWPIFVLKDNFWECHQSLKMSIIFTRENCTNSPPPHVVSHCNTIAATIINKRH